MKKWKVLLPTAGLITGLASTGALICAAKVQKTNNEANTRTIGWDTDAAYAYGHIEDEGATKSIDVETDFGDLTLPEVHPNPGCELVGWYDSNNNPLYPGMKIQPDGDAFQIRARFLPIVKKVNLPQLINLSVGNDFHLEAEIETEEYDPVEGLTPKFTFQWKIMGDCIEWVSVVPTEENAEIHPKNEGNASIEVSVLDGSGAPKVQDTCAVKVSQIEQKIKKIGFYESTTSEDSINTIEIEYTPGSETPAQTTVYLRINDDSKLSMESLGAGKFEGKYLDDEVPLGSPQIDPVANTITFAEKGKPGRCVYKMTARNTTGEEVTTSLEILVKPKFVPINEILLEGGTSGQTKVVTNGIEDIIAIEVHGAEGAAPTYPNSIIWSVPTESKEYIAVSPNGTIKPIKATPQGTLAQVIATATDVPLATNPVSASVNVQVNPGTWTINYETPEEYQPFFKVLPNTRHLPDPTDPEDNIIFDFELTDKETFTVTADQIDITYGSEKFDPQYIEVVQDSSNPNMYTVTLDHAGYTEIREMTISVLPDLDYTVSTFQGEGVMTTTINDAPFGEDITGNVTFISDSYTKLNIDNCYVEFPDGSKLYGDDIFIYDGDTTPKLFAIDHTALTNTHFSVHLDCSSDNPWENAQVISKGSEIEAHFKENVYGQPILVEFNAANGYQLDTNNTEATATTFVTIRDTDGKDHKCLLNDGSNVFVLNNKGYLQLDTAQIKDFNVDKTSKIDINVCAKQAAFPYSAHTAGEGFGTPVLTFAQDKGQLYKDVAFTWNLDSQHYIDSFDTDNNYIEIEFTGERTQKIGFTIDSGNANLWSFEWNYNWEVNSIVAFHFYVKSLAIQP